MKFKLFFPSALCGLWFLLALAAVQAAPAELPKPRVSVVPDRADGIYKLGEKATFTVTVTQNGKPLDDAEVTYNFTNDGRGDFGSGTVRLREGSAKIEGTIDRPAVLRCRVLYFTSPNLPPVAGYGAAAFEPFKIEPTATEPEDFDEFWSTQKAELARVPIDAQLTPVEDPRNEIKVFEISLANINGTRVRGYLATPAEAGKYPVHLTLPGAGVYSLTPDGVAAMALQGFVAMAISIHDLPNGQPKEFYADQYKEFKNGYTVEGREDRLTYFFRRPILGAVRAIDYLVSRPDWNGKSIIVQGGSQGGGLALITGGLDQRVTAVAANIPALCDFSGKGFGRSSGWPQDLVPLDADGKLDPKILAATSYYDAVNFARRVKVPAIMGVGLIDLTVPPSSSLAAYNVLRGPKEISISPIHGHTSHPNYVTLTGTWLRRMVTD